MRIVKAISVVALLLACLVTVGVIEGHGNTTDGAAFRFTDAGGGVQYFDVDLDGETDGTVTTVDGCATEATFEGGYRAVSGDECLSPWDLAGRLVRAAAADGQDASAVETAP